jgi:DNA repair protein RadA/Sms
MGKKKSYFQCRNCGYLAQKWLGRCPGCGEWNSFDEVLEEKGGKGGRGWLSQGKVAPIPLSEVEGEEVTRFSTGEPELDLVLGGGVVPGSLILIGGSPGIGKSTLMLQVAGKVGGKVLYVTGEESPSQVKLRADRLGIGTDQIFLYPEIEVERIGEEIRKGGYRLVIVDSIQTLYWGELQSAPGSVPQIRESTFQLLRVAKEVGVPIFLIGHITKEGAIAGPRLLEHIVDTVLYFEGEGSRGLRILRSFKNRFGSTSEIGLFEIGERGLVSAKTRSFFSPEPQEGSGIGVIIEGNRPLVLEIQGLVTESYGVPRRVSTGFDLGRLNLILALLEKRLQLPFNRLDVFVNVSGGIKIQETGADLPVIVALLSSLRNRKISKGTIFIGEVTLVGEIRGVPGVEQRLKEAKNLGFHRAVLPNPPKNPPLKCYQVTQVEQLLEWM